MRFLNQGLGDPGTEVETRDRAVSTFLDLGEKLRSWYQRDSGPRAAKGVAPVHYPVEGTETLLRAIEGEIIPRLLLVHREAKEEARPAVDATVLTADDHARFLDTVMTESAASTRSLVAQLLQRGVSEEVIFLDLLAQAARRLGELWEEDLCDFADVTIGLCRLHQVLREHGFYEDGGACPASDAPRILLATACGDQHVLGVVMVAEFFRRAGWRVWSDPGASRSQLSTILADEDFDVLGISAACSAVAETLAVEIGLLRCASRNGALKVLVGGRLFQESPDLLTTVGADGVALDARTAPDVGRDLLAQS